MEYTLRCPQCDKEKDEEFSSLREAEEAAEYDSCDCGAVGLVVI